MAITQPLTPTMADRDGFIWFNGQLVKWRDANTHMLTHGLHYASVAFEGERAYNGKVFKLKEHTQRLIESAKILRMTIPYNLDQLMAATNEVVKANNLPNCYLRPIVFRGPEVMGLLPSSAPAHVAIAAWEWPSYFDMATKMKGIKLQWAEWRRPAANTAPVHSKCAGLYMICTLAKMKAEEEGDNDAMFMDYRGLVAEATGANVFFKFNDGKIHTPTPDCFLDGITKHAVSDILRGMGVEVIERPIKPEELANATECFLTGTAAEVTPVKSIGNYQFAPGDFSQMVVKKFYDMVAG